MSGGSHVRGLGLTGSPKPELYFEHSIYDFHEFVEWLMCVECRIGILGSDW